MEPKDQMLDLLQEQNSQLDSNEQTISLKESEICMQVLERDFARLINKKIQRRQDWKTMYLCRECYLWNEVQYLHSQMKFG